MIEKFYTTIFTAKRMVYTANKSSLSSNGTFDGHLQQAAPELVASLADTYKLSHTIWCSRSEDVQSGDQLETGGNKYTVQSVQDNSTGNNDHYELHVLKA